MEAIARWVWREAGDDMAGSNRQSDSPPAADVDSSDEILDISSRQVRRVRRKVESWGMSAVMD